MSIIYSYPIKGTPANDDLILISDSASSPQFATKQIKVSSLPGGSASGVSSFNTLTGAITITGGTNVTLNPVGNNIEINAAGGGGSTQPGNPSASIQYNDGSGAFAGSANLTFATNTLTLTDTLDIKGDGTNPGTLKLYCEDTTTPHAVSILGPVHSGATPYSIRLPKEIATQTVYSSGGRVLESDASGALQWIVTPTGGGAPGGSSTQFQYNNGTTFAGTDSLRFDADKIHMGRSTSPITRGQLVMYGDGTNASDIQLYNSSNNRFLKLAQQAGATQDLTLTFPGQASGGNNKILESDSSGQLSWIDTPTGGGISFSGTTANGIATYSNSTTATVSSVFTVSGNKLSAPAGTLADPSIEVGAVGGLYAASGGITLAHNGANAIGVSTSSIVNYKLTQFQAGLKFGSTGETLNSYEEGTWLPTSANANTISNVSGDYTRIGDMVFAQFSFTMTGATTVAISGLPFQGVYTSALKGGVIISADSCTSVQGQLKGGQFTGTNSFTFNSYFGSGGGLPTQLRQVTASMYQTSGGTYAGVIIYETTE